MNLGQAVAVCLHELVREENAPAKAEKRPSATAAELDHLTAMLLDALRISGYVKSNAAGPTAEKIRRLIRRLNLSAEDAQVWLGIVSPAEITTSVPAGASFGRVKVATPAATLVSDVVFRVTK